MKVLCEQLNELKHCAILLFPPLCDFLVDSWRLCWPFRSTCVIVCTPVFPCLASLPTCSTFNRFNKRPAAVTHTGFTEAVSSVTFSSNTSNRRKREKQLSSCQSYTQNGVCKGNCYLLRQNVHGAIPCLLACVMIGSSALKAVSGHRFYIRNRGAVRIS